MKKPPVDKASKAVTDLERIEAKLIAEEKRHARNVKSLKTRRTKLKARVRYYDRKAETEPELQVRQAADRR